MTLGTNVVLSNEVSAQLHLEMQSRKSRISTRSSQNKRNQKLTTSSRSSRGRTRRQIPVAFSFSARSTATLKHRPDGSAILKSTEIFPIYSQSTGLSYMLPMTPSKWANTRTCALSYTYSSHRPLQCHISWEPAVSTSTPGSVAIGTVFAGARLPNETDSWSSISRSLACTNGGFISTIWDHHDSYIHVARNLRANQFPLYEVNADDIPFWICVATSDTSGSTIGYLVVTTVFSLRNPLSGSISQPVTGSGQVQINHDDSQNTTTMSVPQSMINHVLGIGADYLWTFGSNLVNTVGSTVSSILSTVVARLSAIEGSFYKFTLDSHIGTQQALGYIIGNSANF